MALIDRTAYPVFPRHFPTSLLAADYTPTLAEIAFGYRTARVSRHPFPSRI